MVVPVPVLSSVPLVRVRFIRTASNKALATQTLKATPTVRSLTVNGQHGFIDPLEDVTSQIDPDTGVGYLDVLATDDPDVAEAFGWQISFDGSTRPVRTVQVPQQGPAVETVTDSATGAQMPAVWLNQLADFTGASGPVGSDLATMTFVDDAIRQLQQTPDPFPQYRLDSESGAVTDATMADKGIACLLGGTADAPTVPAEKVTGVLDDARIPATITRDSELASAVTAALVEVRGGAPAAYDTLMELIDRLATDESGLASLLATVGGKSNVKVDGVHVDEYNVDSTPITAADLNAALRAPLPAAARYFFPASQSSIATSNALGNSVARVAPWVLSKPARIDRLGAEITAVGEAGSKLRLMIYADNGNAYPGALLLDAGVIAGDSATLQELVVDASLPAGLLWIGAAVQAAPTTQPTVRIIGTGWTPPVPISLGTIPVAGQALIGFSAAGVSGAAPSTLAPSASGTVPRLFVRLAA